MSEGYASEGLSLSYLWSTVLDGDLCIVVRIFLLL